MADAVALVSVGTVHGLHGLHALHRDADGSCPLQQIPVRHDPWVFPESRPRLSMDKRYSAIPPDWTETLQETYYGQRKLHIRSAIRCISSASSCAGV